MSLSPLERRAVTELARDGASDKVIADRLGVEYETVKSYLAGARRKAGVRSRTALALWWIRRGRYEHADREAAA